MPMSTMNISLPESMKQFVDERLSEHEYGTASEYVRELIRSDQRRREEEKLERLLLERLESDSVNDWSLDEAKRALKKRFRK